MYDGKALMGSIAWPDGGGWGSGLLVTVTSIESVRILSGTAFNFQRVLANPMGKGIISEVAAVGGYLPYARLSLG